MNKVSIVIPNYNGDHLLPICLDSLLRQTRLPDEIIVVDDASTDQSVPLLRTRYPTVRLVVAPVNRGFCHTVNIGLKLATGEYVGLLNNDTEVDAHWIAELVGALDCTPEIGFCACKMLFADQRDRINSAGLFLRVDGVARDIGFGMPDDGRFDAPCRVFGASGGALMCRHALLETVGLLDEDLVAYAEDVDLSFRAQLQGWSCLYVPTAIVYHRVSATYAQQSSRKVYYSSRNMFTVLVKNMPTALLVRYAIPILLTQVFQVAYFTLHRRGLSALRGKWDSLRALPTTLRKRRLIAKMRRTSTESIAALLTPISVWSRWQR